MKRSGHADLPLHHGKVPRWLSERMSRLGGAILEAIILEYGRKEVIRRISDPMWFQSLGCVLGMDWHSSGITTSVLGALKASVNPKSHELGIYFCGGRGKHSRKTPEELLIIADKTGLDGENLVRSSRLSAKVDNNTIQDGYQIYLHSFIVSKDGEWSVVQQGLNDQNGYARRYHWHSNDFNSFVEEPHTAVCGENQGQILNLTAESAQSTRDSIYSLTRDNSALILKEAQRILTLPSHHNVKNVNVNLKRLGGVLVAVEEAQPADFESLLLTKDLGPRTLRSLALVSEVIHGTPSRFEDPARFSFAHGGKDGHPHPVPLKVYDESIRILKTAVEKSKIGYTDKKKALHSLHKKSMEYEKSFEVTDGVEKIITHEWNNKSKYGGRTVMDDKPKRKLHGNGQMNLFQS